MLNLISLLLGLDLGLGFFVDEFFAFFFELVLVFLLTGLSNLTSSFFFFPLLSFQRPVCVSVPGKTLIGDGEGPVYCNVLFPRF